MKYGDTFFQVWKKIEADTELVGFDEGEITLGKEFGGLVAIGTAPPRKVNDLAYFTTTSGEEERWFLTKSYETGDVGEI